MVVFTYPEEYYGEKKEVVKVVKAEPEKKSELPVLGLGLILGLLLAVGFLGR